MEKAENPRASGAILVCITVLEPLRSISNWDGGPYGRANDKHSGKKEKRKLQIAPFISRGAPSACRQESSQQTFDVDLGYLRRVASLSLANN